MGSETPALWKHRSEFPNYQEGRKEMKLFQAKTKQKKNQQQDKL